MARLRNYELEPVSGWKGLAGAIVEQAAKDYKTAYKSLQNSRYFDYRTNSVIIEVTAFFRSDWFALLTDVNPDWLIETIKRSCL